MKHLLPALIAIPTLLSAQIQLTGSLVVARHHGHSLAAEDAGQPRILPGAGLGGALAISMDRGPLRLALMLERQGGADLLIVGDESGVVTRDMINSTSFGLDLGARIAGDTELASLHLLAGIRSIRWSFDGVEDPAVTRVGAVLAIEGATPVGPRLHSVIRADATFSGGLFDADQLPEGYERETGRRLALMVGLRWQP
ncbi:MAG TPA: hypothetical protein PLL69_04870 [Gemmatimonadales bacterium]|nr:hypothetical protein [Gemmatimonadales bacterium]